MSHKPFFHFTLTCSRKNRRSSIAIIPLHFQFSVSFRLIHFHTSRFLVLISNTNIIRLSSHITAWRDGESNVDVYTHDNVLHKESHKCKNNGRAVERIPFRIQRIRIDGQQGVCGSDDEEWNGSHRSFQYLVGHLKLDFRLFLELHR